MYFALEMRLIGALSSLINVSRYGAPCVESASVVFIAMTRALMFPNAFVSTSLNVMLRVEASSYSNVKTAVFVVAN